MADQNNTGISNNDINKAKEYKDTLDSLHRSLTNVNSALPSFADGVKEGLKAVAEKLPEVVDSMMKLNAQNRELAANGQRPVSVLSQLSSSLFSWNTVIQVGLTLLVTYGSAFVKWVGDLMKGETTLTALNREIRENKIVMNALIASRTKGTLSAQQELAQLKMLYDMTRDTSAGKQNQIKAVDELRKRYPDLLKGLKDEAVLAGEAKGAYEKLKKEITAGYQVRNHADQLGKNQEREILNNEKLSHLMAKQVENTKLLTKAEQDYEKAKKDYKTDGTSDDNIRRLALVPYSGKVANLAKQAEDIKREIGILEKDNERLGKQNGALQKETSKNVETYGIEILTGKKRSEDKTPDKENGKPKSDAGPDLGLEERLASKARLATLTLKGYAKEIEQAEQHFKQLKEQHKNSNETVEQLELERVTTIDQINKRFQKEGSDKLDSYQKELTDIAQRAGKNAQQLAIIDLQDQKKTKDALLDKELTEGKARQQIIQKQMDNATAANNTAQLAKLQSNFDAEFLIELKAIEAKKQLNENLARDIAKIKADEADQKQRDQQAKNEQEIQRNIQTLNAGGHHIQALEQQKVLLDMQYEAAKANALKTGESIEKIERETAEKKKAIEEQLVRAKIHAGDKYLDAVLKHSNKNSAIFKAAFVAKKAVAIADIIIDTKKALIASFTGYASMPFIGQALAIAQGAFIAGQAASSIAEIAKQKPGFARGGHFVSDGRGALLGGYSRTDDTNAYLRSGEAVVVSEAMRNPWARNLVSAINVAHGGRDFSIANPARGYAMGGVFTDGGNANRYYSQPVTDVKDLANTLAYQMINNFPPIYVDVKDVNNQQNILAQTVDRVNL